MSERAEGTIEIAAPPPEVLAAIIDFDSYPEWAGVQRAEVLSRDAQGRPTDVAMRVSEMGFEAEYTLSYEYAPGGRVLSWTTKEAGGAIKDVEGEYVLEPSGTGTKVTYRLALDLAISLPGFLRRQGEKIAIGRALGGLRRYVEGGE